MQIWQVSLDYEADLTTQYDDEDLVDVLVAMGEDLGHDAAVGGGRQGLSVTLAMEAYDSLAAAHQAMEIVYKHADSHGLPYLGQPVDVHARTWERAEADLETPNYPDIVSAVEVAEILGVSRQRVHQLHKDNASFPEPLYELRTGPLWVRAGIEAFARSWERKPGRPAIRKAILEELADADRDNPKTHEELTKGVRRRLGEDE